MARGRRGGPWDPACPSHAHTNSTGTGWSAVRLQRVGMATWFGGFLQRQQQPLRQRCIAMGEAGPEVAQKVQVGYTALLCHALVPPRPRLHCHVQVRRRRVVLLPNHPSHAWIDPHARPSRSEAGIAPKIHAELQCASLRGKESRHAECGGGRLRWRPSAGRW
eukprot:1894571-Rhodomonas_salina.2